MDVNTLTECLVEYSGIVDVPQHRMCHHMVLYSCQLMRSPFEALAIFFIDGLVVDSRRLILVDYMTPTLEDGEHPWLF